MNQDDSQPNPRILQALGESSEALSQVVAAILEDRPSTQEAAESAIAQGFALGMEYLLAEDESKAQDGQGPEAPMEMIRGLLGQIDQYLIDHPQAQQMLTELRKPLAQAVQQHVAQTRTRFISALASVYGKEYAEMIADGEELTDEQRERIAIRDITSGPLGSVDLLAFATQYHKMPEGKCRCLACQRDAFNKSPLTMDTARDQMERDWPDTSKLMIAYGQSRQDMWRTTFRKLSEGAQGEHFDVHATPDPEAAQQILGDALKKFGIQSKKG